MAKVLDQPAIPGGDPDKPKKFRKGPECSTRSCERPAMKEGMCGSCHDQHVEEMGQQPSEDQWNEAFEKARDT